MVLFVESAEAARSITCSPPGILLHFENEERLDCAVINVKPNGESQVDISFAMQRYSVKGLKFFHSDEYLRAIDLRSHGNPMFSGPRSGQAIEIVFPEKSTAIIYWDRKLRSPKVFWESD
jgi:hypothetical protein